MDFRKTIRKTCQKYIKQNRRKATFSEKKFRTFLKKHKIKHIFQYPLFYSSTFIILIDFCILKHKIAIEIDGSSHANRNKGWREHEGKRERLMKRRGFKLCRLTDKDVMLNTDKCRRFKHKILKLFKDV